MFSFLTGDGALVLRLPARRRSFDSFDIAPDCGFGFGALCVAIAFGRSFTRQAVGCDAWLRATRGCGRKTVAHPRSRAR